MDVAPAGREHEGLGGQFGKGECTASSKAVCRWQNGDPWVLSNRKGIAVGWWVEDDTEIDEPSLQPGLDLPIVRFERNQLNARMEGAEASQEGRQHGGEDAGKGCYPDRSGFLAGHLRRLFSDRLQMRQSSAGMVQRLLSVLISVEK